MINKNLIDNYIEKINTVGNDIVLLEAEAYRRLGIFSESKKSNIDVKKAIKKQINK